jgi:class 3 adenylate cyclase/pimeloyl-ACP methyl ester carboxylesterase
MAEARVERRLAAILALDVVGYSRLIGIDEEGTVAALKACRRKLIDPKISEHRGRIVKTTGDGALVEFASAVEATRCALEIQRGAAQRNVSIPKDHRIEFRIGINIGDVIADDGDLYGDGVNIAARIEPLARPGGVCVSENAYQQIKGKFPLDVIDLGEQQLKNITEPVRVYVIHSDEEKKTEAFSHTEAATQEISYCRSPDGVRLAFAVAGNGPVLVKTGNWLNHLEYDWESPVWRHLVLRLARNHTLIRYDARGNGLSDWEVPELSVNVWVRDLETVVDRAGLQTFPLLGISQGCAVSIAYAAKHPERISKLILYGGFVLGAKKRSPDERDKRNALATLMRLGWGQENSTFREVFTNLFIPGATKHQKDFFNELERRTTSPEMATKMFEASGDIDVTSLMGKVRAPTLVMHVRGDLMVPVDAGRAMANGIPGARFVVLQGQNHLFLENEPASLRFFEEIDNFLNA